MSLIKSQDEHTPDRQDSMADNNAKDSKNTMSNNLLPEKRPNNKYLLPL